MRPSKPRQTGEAQNGGDIEVQAQPEQVLGRVDAQELLEDAKGRVAGDVEGEQPPGGSGDGARARRAPRPGEVPDQLVEEGRLEGGILLIARRTVGRIDLKRPGRLVGPPNSSWLK